MTFQEIINPKKYVRVIDSTYNPNKETKEMVGGEFEVRVEWYSDKTVAVWNKDKSDSWGFNRSDVQFLTPVEYKGKRVAIGDEVLYCEEWCKVYGYFWYDGYWKLNTVQNNDFENKCYYLRAEDIQDHRTPQNNEDEIQKAIELLKSKGRLVDGQILN